MHGSTTIAEVRMRSTSCSHGPLQTVAGNGVFQQRALRPVTHDLDTKPDTAIPQ
jgi:hypothetical protein